MSENPEFEDGDTAETPATAANAASPAEPNEHERDDLRIDEWEDESFPASDPPANY